MKKNVFLSMLAIQMIALLSIGFASCTEEDNPEPPVVTLEVQAPNEILLSAEGTSESFGISVKAENTDWNVTVSQGNEWLHANKSDQTVSIFAEKNISTSERNGIITITAANDPTKTYHLNVKQVGEGLAILVDSSSMEFESEGGTTTVQVSCNSGWSASSNQGWLTVSPSSKAATSRGFGSDVVTLTASENTTRNDRTCVVTFTTTQGEDTKIATISVTQKKQNPYIQVNGLTTTELKYEGDFNGKSGVDFKQTVNVTSNVEWNVTGVPSWLSVSPNKGNGTVTMSIYPTSENVSASDRKATITLTGTGGEATIKVTQGPSLSPVKVNPSNIVPLYNQIGWDLEAVDNVNKFRQIMVTEAVFKNKTDKELLEDLETDDPSKYADDYIFFYAYDSYGNKIKQNTSYYICTVAYDENDKRGEIVKTKVTTPTYLDADDDAWVSFSDVRAGLTQGFQFTATKEGYCNTYHVIYGNLPSNYNYNNVVYAFQIQYYINNKKKHWYAKNWDLEIVTDYPNNHTFTYSTTSLSQYPLVAVYAWGVFKNGKISSDLQGFSWDISEEGYASRARKMPSCSNEPCNLVIKRSEEEERAKNYRK